MKTGERSVPEKPVATSTPAIPQQPVTIPIMMPDQPLNNPRFNPNPPMPPMNIPQMFQPFPGGFDPRFSLPLGVQDPRLQHLAIPRADWVEMILIYGDGSFHRTIRDHSPMVTTIFRCADVKSYNSHFLEYGSHS